MFRVSAAAILILASCLPLASWAELPWYCSDQKLACLTKPYEERVEAARAYAADPANEDCLVGGSFSKFENPERGVRRCAGIADPSCAAEETLCNPNLFCLVGSRTGRLCVGRLATHEWSTETEWCSTEFTVAKRREQNRLFECNPWNGGEAARAEILKTEARFLEKCRRDQKFQDAFCGECNIVGRRIYEMNSGSVERGCVPVAREGGPLIRVRFTPSSGRP